MNDEQPTWEQILDDPARYGYSDADVERILNERKIGLAANILHTRGQDSAAALMLDVQSLSVSFVFADGLAGWGSQRGTTEAVLDVESYLVPRFTEERLAEIESALDVVLDHEAISIAFTVAKLLPAAFGRILKHEAKTFTNGITWTPHKHLFRSF